MWNGTPGGGWYASARLRISPLNATCPATLSLVSGKCDSRNGIFTESFWASTKTSDLVPSAVSSTR